MDPSTIPPPPAWRDRAAAAVPDALPTRVVAIGAVATLVVGVIAYGILRREPPPVRLPPDPAVADAQLSSRPSQPPAHVFVHAAGAVARPGVYRVVATARVSDVLDAAGGPTAEADVDQLNLAEQVRDGQRVYVPRRGEAVPSAAPLGTAGAAAGPLDLNAATAEQLDTLPGVGPSTAAAIIEQRTRKGRFRSVDDLLDVPGIGEARLARLRPLVRV